MFCLISAPSVAWPLDQLHSAEALPATGRNCRQGIPHTDHRKATDERMALLVLSLALGPRFTRNSVPCVVAVKTLTRQCRPCSRELQRSKGARTGLLLVREHTAELWYFVLTQEHSRVVHLKGHTCLTCSLPCVRCQCQREMLLRAAV